MSDQTYKASSTALPGNTDVSEALSQPRSNVNALDLFNRWRDGLGLAVVYIFLGAMTIFALFPIYYVLQASLDPLQSVNSTTLHLLPKNASLENYTYILSQTKFPNWVWNSIWISALATTFGLTISVTGAYALSRFRFNGRGTILLVLLALQAFPGLLAVTAFYFLFIKLGILNNNTSAQFCLALIYGAGAIVFGVWNIKGYFDTLPGELEEAALVDGATPTKTFIEVMLPLALPSLAASALFMFIGNFNEFALASYILPGDQNGAGVTFPLGLKSLTSDYRVPWGQFAAASVMMSIPLMAFFAWAQRFFQSGLTVGSVKG